MVKARRVKRQPATPTSPLAGRGQKDEDSASSSKSIEIFRDNNATQIPVCETKVPRIKKARRVIHKPKEINYLKFLLSDDESSPTRIQDPGLTCSTPVAGNSNNTSFTNASAVISPIAHATLYPKHIEEVTAKKSPASDFKITNLWKDQEVAQNNETNKTENGVCNKDTGVLQDVKLIAFPGEKAVAKPSIKPPSSYPVCPLLNLIQKPKHGAIIKMPKNIIKDHKRPHEYPHCPLEILNFRKNVKQVTVKDEVF